MRWKWISIFFAAIVIVVIVAVYSILSSYDFNRLKPHIERAAYEATGRELTLGGDIELEIGLTPALVVKDVTFQNAKWGSRPAAVSIRRFEVQVAILPLLGGNIDVKRLILIEPDILIETDRRGRSNLEFVPPEKPETEEERDQLGDEPELPALMVGEFLLENGLLTHKDGRSGKSTLVKLERLSAGGSGTGSIDSAVDIDLRGSLDGRSFGISGRLDSLASITGSSRGPFKLSALKIKFGRNVLTGSVEADITAVRPRLAANLSADSLDLREFLKGEAKGGAVETGGAGKPAIKSVKREKVFSDEPIPIESMKGVDLDLHLKAKRLYLPKLALSDLSVAMSLKDGHLKLSPVKAKAGGGTLDATVDLRPRGKAVEIGARVKIDNLELDKMGKELKITETLNGTIDAYLKVKGKGGSVAALMATLDGEKRVVMGKGRIDNKLLSFFGGDLSSNLLRLVNPLAAQEKYTVVNCMVVGFNVDDGLARSSALVFDTSHMSIVGNGKVNFKTEELDISLKPLPKEGLGTGGLGKLTLSLGELARPFKLGGTLANPGLAVDPAQTMLTIGKVMGGTALLGPAGIATALVGTSSGDENPCLTAIESQKKRAAPKPVEKKGDASKPSGQIPEEIQEIGEGLLKLLGR